MGCSNTTTTQEQKPQSNQQVKQENQTGSGAEVKKSEGSFSDIKKVALGNGETYAYREKSPADASKPGKTMVFLHATACSSQMLDTGNLLETLVAKFPTYRFIAPDWRGHGHSTYVTKLNSNDELAEDLKLFLDALKLDKVVLVATCLGGYAGGLFAARYPEKLDSLILIGAMTMLGGEIGRAHV